MSAVIQDEYTGNGSKTDYNFTFPYLKTSDIKASLNGVETTAFTLQNATTIQFNTAPANQAKIKIFRETGVDNLTATFYAGSAIKSEDLNDNFTQNLFSTQEVSQRYLSNLGGTMTGNIHLAKDVDITYEGDTENDFETRFTVVDPTADRTINFPNVKGTVVTTGDTGTVTGTMIADSTITSGDIVDGTIVNADINASADIAVSKLDHGTARQILQTNAAGNGVEFTNNVDIPGTLDVTGNVDLDSNLNVDGNTTLVGTLDVDGSTTLDDTTVDGGLNVNGYATIDNITINGSTINTNTDYISVVKSIFPSADDNIDLGSSTKQFKDLYIDGTGNIDNIVADTITGGAVVTTGASTADNKVYSAKRAGEIFYEKGTLDDITSGNAWVSDDNKLATTAAIDARITDLVDDVGGFVPIANETSFPNANPDINNGAGTLVSIQSLSQNLTSNAAGEVVIANGTVGNSTVFLVGAPASTTFASGFGLIVETKDNTGGVANTYTFHRLVPKATEVTTVAGSIANVNTTATNIGNVNSVGGNIANVNSVAGNATNINSAVSNASNINSAVSNASNINTVAGISGNVTTVAGISSNVTTVANDGTDIGTVATNIGNVNTVAGISSNVTTVANNNSNVTAVAGNATNINAVANNASNINSAATNASNINSAVSNASNINTVAGNTTNVNTVAGISGNVTTVAGIASNVTTVAGNNSNVSTVAGSIANVNTTAGSIANVNTTAGSIGNVNTVASNITNVNNASTYLNNFLSLYLGTSASAPSSDALGNAVTEGDLYFNTGTKQLNIFNGSVFTNIVDTAIDFAKSATAAFNALYTASAGSNSIDLGGLAITGAAFANEAVATNRISLAKGSATYNLGGI